MNTNTLNTTGKPLLCTAQNCHLPHSSSGQPAAESKAFMSFIHTTNISWYSYANKVKYWERYLTSENVLLLEVVGKCSHLHFVLKVERHTRTHRKTSPLPCLKNYLFRRWKQNINSKTNVTPSIICIPLWIEMHILLQQLVWFLTR